jgi:hypothetical protein
MRKFLSTCTLDCRSIRKKQDTRRKGPTIFSSKATIITNGLKIFTKQRTAAVSNELTLPMFPVPKNDRKI